MGCPRTRDVTRSRQGNAPIKPTHTVNDGGAKKGASSFTESEVPKHIEHAGYGAVTGLSKGKDGVWRGVAMKGGAPLNVGLDFKGNVSEGAPVAAAAPRGSMARSETNVSPTPTATAAGTGVKTAKPHRHHVACKTPGPNGTACSGIDRNKNGISDKEDRAINSGAKP